MANKRFLGLGFSFAAQDRGLEKKLLNIKAAIDGINASLTKVSSSSSKASSGIMNVSSASPSGNPMKNAVRMLKFAKKAGLRPTRKKEEPESKTMSLSEGFSKLSGEAQSQIKEVFGEIAKSSKISGDVLFENTKEQLNELKITVDKAGNLTKESRKNFFSTVKGYADGVSQVQKQTSMMSRAFFGLGNMLVSVKGYLSDVGRSFENLLQTVGVNLRDLVPPQLAAMLGVAKAIIAPLINLPGKIGGFFKQKSEERSKKEGLKLQKKFVDAQGFSGGSDTLKAALLDLAPEKKGGGFMDKIKGAFSGLKGLLTGLGTGLVTALGPKAVASVFSKIWDAIVGGAKAFIAFIAAFPAAFKTWKGMIWNTIQSIFTEALPAAFNSLGASIRSFFEIIKSAPGKLMARAGEFFAPIARVFSNISKMKGIDVFIGGLDAIAFSIRAMLRVGHLAVVAVLIESLVSAIGGLFSGVKDGLSSWSGVFDSWKKAFSSIGSMFVELGGLIKESAIYAYNQASKFFSDVWKGLIEGISSIPSFIEELRKSSPVFDFVAKGVMLLVDALSLFLKTVAEGWRNIGGWLVGGSGMLAEGAGNAVASFFDSVTAGLKKTRESVQKQNEQDYKSRTDEVSRSRMSPLNTLNEQNQVKADQQQVVALLQTQNELQKAHLEQTQQLTQVTKDKELKVDVSKLGIGAMSAATSKRRSDIAEAMARGIMSQSPVTAGI